MPIPAGSMPLAADELLYRRVPASQSWYNPPLPTPKDAAFLPNRGDVNGLSLSRAIYYERPELAAYNGRGKSYYLAAFERARLEDHGIRVIADMLDTEPWHASLPQIRFDLRDDSWVREMAKYMASICVKPLLGPFTQPPE